MSANYLRDWSQIVPVLSNLKQHVKHAISRENSIILVCINMAFIFSMPKQSLHLPDCRVIFILETVMCLSKIVHLHSSDMEEMVHNYKRVVKGLGCMTIRGLG